MTNKTPSCHGKSVALYVMGHKGYEVLRMVNETTPEFIAVVVSAPDQNMQDDYFIKIREYCDAHQIEFRVRDESFEVSAQYVLAVSWRWLIKLENAQIIIFHDSLLPRYRGFNPLVSCLINGESRIGVTALFASEDYDCGPIIAQASTNIDYPIKIHRAIELVIQNYLTLVNVILEKISSCSAIEANVQNNVQASYSLWRDDEDYRIDWFRPAVYIARFVDAIGFPYKGAYTLVNGRPSRLLDADVLDDVFIENRVPGKVIFIRDNYPVVVCGVGLLRIKNLVDDETGQSLLPLEKFRSRFT